MQKINHSIKSILIFFSQKKTLLVFVFLSTILIGLLAINVFLANPKQACAQSCANFKLGSCNVSQAGCPPTPGTGNFCPGSYLVVNSVLAGRVSANDAYIVWCYK